MDFHAAMETFAEAWVAANTQTAATDPQTVRQKSTEDLPTMLPKEKILDSEPLEISPPETSIQPCKTPPIASPTLSQSPSPSTPVKDLSSQVKSIPIHCVVEQVPSAIDFGSDSKAIESQPHIELDSYAILPQSTPLFDIVGAALIKLGYSTQESFGAKGAIQIKNWKPLPFDVITDSPRASVEDILGELANIVTLRIRLCSKRNIHNSPQHTKDKLLLLLLSKSQDFLLSVGCPITKDQLAIISETTSADDMDEDIRAKFFMWYNQQIRSGFMSSAFDSMKRKMTNFPITSSPVKTSKMMPEKVHPAYQGLTGFGGLQGNQIVSPGKARVRISFDPETEIPKLQLWFQQDPHPSREMLHHYMNILNSQESRKYRKPLDLNNIVYWFKNSREACRRRNNGDSSFDSSVGNDSVFNDSPSKSDDEEDVENEQHVEEASKGNCIPELPNKNAVYITTPVIQKTGPLVLKIESKDNQNSSIPESAQSENNQAMTEDRCNSVDSVKSLKIETNNNKVHGCASPTENKVQYTQDQPEDLSVKRHRISDIVQDMNDKYDDDVSDDNEDDIPYRKTLPYHPNIGMMLPNHLAHFQSIAQMSALAAHTPALFNPLAGGLNQNGFHMPMYMQHYYNNTLSSQHKRATSLSPPSSQTPTSQPPSPQYPSPMSPASRREKRKRTRVFIDPMTEIPRLEKWFTQETHPTSVMIEDFCDELNRSEYRQKFPKLEPKNVQLWFKNHRAKVKRLRQTFQPFVQ